MKPTGESKLLILANERGSSLITILVASATLGIAMYVLMTGWTSSTKQVHQVNLRLSAINLRSNIEQYFRSDSSWIKMRQDNTNAMTCLKQPAPPQCATLNAQPITRILDGAGDEIYVAPTGSPTVDPDGFNLMGEHCDPTSNTDAGCPFRVEVSWKPQCPSTPCNPTLIEISGKVILKDPTALQQKAENYSFKVIRAP